MAGLSGFSIAFGALLSFALFAQPAGAANVGADPPQRCPVCGCTEPSGPSGMCSNAVPGSSGTSFSASEGTNQETYPVVSVKSSTGPMLKLYLDYESYNADGTRARFNTGLGYGWTHSNNQFLFSQLGSIFRMDGDGRVTKYQFGGGTNYTAAPGYFETIVRNPDGSFTITDKYKTATRYIIVANTHFFQGTPVWRPATITDRSNNVTSYTYSSGNLVKVTDTYGRAITFTYDAGNRLTSITDPLGRVTSFAYDATGANLATITDPAGRTTRYTYDLQSHITSKTDKDGRRFTYTYTSGEPTGYSDSTATPYFTMSNPSNWATDPTQLAQNAVRQYVPSTTNETDGRGNVWKYTYDLHGYITTLTAPDGATWHYTYDPGTLMPATETDADIHTTSFQYDARGNVTRRTDALGFVTTYTYEPVFNQMTSMTDPNGRTTSNSYDARGNEISSTDPLGGTEHWTYDAHGNVLTNTDKDGHTTSYGYDAFGDRVQTTDALGNVSMSTYDAVGNVISTTDANGHTTTDTYDPLDRITTVTDPLGGTTITVYDGQGNRTQTTDRDSHVTQYHYDQRNRVTQQIDALGHSTLNAYDANNNVVSATDKNGHTSTATYDVQNRQTQLVDALGDTTLTSYDPEGNKITQTDPDGHVTQYAYDALNRLVTQTDAVGTPVQRTTTNGYDSVGPCAGCTGPTKGSNLVSEKIDALGHVIYYKYDGDDRLIREVHKQGGTADTETPTDAVTVTTYDPFGNRLTVTEPDGNAITFTYDADNRLIKVVNAAGDTRLIAYDPVGNIVATTEPTGNVIANTYDADNRLTLIQDGAGTVGSFTYDPVGNQLSRTDGNGNTTSTTYDAIYRVTQVTDPLGKTTTNTYDAFGNLLTITDRNGEVTTDTYDAINRRISMTDALGNTTQYQYDPVGNLIKITDANNHATTYAYDALNRMTTETYADGLSRIFIYDAVNNLVTRVDQNGATTNYTYGDLYFLLQRTYPVSPPDVMTYDLSGRMLTATRGSSTVTFTYDGADRIVQTTQNGQTISYSYNIPGRTEAITYPGGRTITQTYDIRSRLSRVDDPASVTPIVQYTYDAGDRVTERDYRNGTTAIQAYNANDWTTQLQHSAGVNPIAGFVYDYDNEGNKKFENKLQDPADSEAYQYDNTYRLTDFRVGTLSGPIIPVPTTETQWTLDALGNWIQKITTGSPVELRTHNAVNEITSINGNPLTYDNDGNLTADTRFTYAYDEENRLVAVTRNSDSVVVAQYQYDALGRRVQKIANPSGVPVTTRYFYDSRQVVEEQNTGGTTQATYVYGNYVDEVLTMDRSGQTHYYHQNALWSVEAITNSAATTVESHAYDAYGLPATSGGGIGNPYLFTGREFDAEAGDYFYRARHQDPVKGRLLQRDPLGYVDGMNLYWYVKDNPINNLDPYGQVTWYVRTGVDWDVKGYFWGWEKNWAYIGYTKNFAKVDTGDCCTIDFNRSLDASHTSWKAHLHGRFWDITHKFNTQAVGDVSRRACICKGQRVDGVEINVYHVYSTDESVSITLGASAGIEANLGSNAKVTAGLNANVTIPASAYTSSLLWTYLVCPTDDAAGRPVVTNKGTVGPTGAGGVVKVTDDLKHRARPWEHDPSVWTAPN